jgi:hypothetical protein
MFKGIWSTLVGLLIEDGQLAIGALVALAITWAIANSGGDQGRDGARPRGRESLPRGRERSRASELCAAVAPALVVVPDADGLHERLDDGRPDEAEPALLQILR